MEKTIQEEFLSLYQKWEEYLKSRYGENMYDSSKRIYKDEKPLFDGVKISENNLLGLVNIRNAYAHSKNLLEIKDPAVDILRNFNPKEFPAACCGVSIVYNNIYYG